MRQISSDCNRIVGEKTSVLKDQRERGERSSGDSTQEKGHKRERERGSEKRWAQMKMRMSDEIVSSFSFFQPR